MIGNLRVLAIPFCWLLSGCAADGLPGTAAAVDGSPQGAPPADALPQPTVRPCHLQWSIEPTQTGIFDSLWASDPRDAYAVQPEGRIFHSNGTGRWDVVYDADNCLTTIWGSGPMDVYAAGVNCRPFGVPYGLLFHSTDGGRTWSTRYSKWNDTPFAGVQGIHGIGANDIYIVSDNGVWRSLDRADSWTNIGHPAGNIYGVLVLEPRTVFVFGDLVDHALIARRQEQNWDTLVDAADHTGAVLSMAALGDRVYAAGTHGLLLRSDNRGSTWTLIDTGTRRSLYSVWAEEGGAIVVGEDATIITSADGFATLEHVAIPGVQLDTLHAVTGAARCNILIGGEHGTIIHGRE